jgi:epoxyqueuosine reductase QueG
MNAPAHQSLTQEIKLRASELHADLCGVGNIERWANCPDLMSPRGILPAARSVIVCGLHHGDATVEIGGERHPQELGPYALQYFMNDQLDVIAYELARRLEDRGYQAIPIASSNIWRYRAYKDLKAVFAPDMSHIYAAVAAGLAELGYHGLAMTPQYGPRVRFISVITDAPLTPDPLLPGNTLCDRCKLCVRHCPSGALDKELRGEAYIEIENRKYRFADKNLWRCSWGEHFDLDLDLPIPDKVDEKVLLDTMTAHGLRGGEMGQCLKFCLPAGNRTFDRKHTSAPRRAKARAAQHAPLADARQRQLAADIIAGGSDLIVIKSAQQWRAEGVDIMPLLPGARHMGLVAARHCEPAADPAAHGDALAWAATHVAGHAAFFAARTLESYGYDAAAYRAAAPVAKAAEHMLGGRAASLMFVTNAPLSELHWTPPAAASGAVPELAQALAELAASGGADAMGIASADAVDAVAACVRPAYEGQPVLNARNLSHKYVRYEPQVTPGAKHVPICGDYVPGARAVIVLGARLPRASVERMGKEPAQAIGPYAMAHYQSLRTLQLAARRLVRELMARGYRAAASADLLGTGSLSASCRGPLPDIFCNALLVPCAGMGTVGEGGFAIHQRFGANMRYFAVVTDAPLPAAQASAQLHLRARCRSCSRCIHACPAKAYGPIVSVKLDGKMLTYRMPQALRCDWAKRYALMASEGFGYLGSTLELPVPREVTAESLSAALRQLDPITKDRPCTAEMCAMACPYAR